MENRPEGGIVKAGAGWIVSGAASILLYLYQEGNAVCNCPDIPTGISQQAALVICRCPMPSPALIAVGILAVLSGAWIIVARKRIEALRERLVGGRRGYKSK